MADIMQMPPPNSNEACPKCGARGIPIRSTLWDRLWHSSAVSKFECDVCDYRFFLRPSLYRKMKRE